MDDHIIDCCSLLNLYTGWGGLTELRDLRRTWHICEAVLNEMEYTREYGPDGAPVLIPLDMSALCQLGPLLPARPETEREIEDYVNFASEVDDGEAQALAIAKHRGFVLLTDDRRAIKFAQRLDVAVRTTSTANILQAWAQLNPRNETRLYKVIPRIAALARFNPRPDSPEYAWWKRYFQHE
jgi:hypothetical protein